MLHVITSICDVKRNLTVWLWRCTCLLTVPYVLSLNYWKPSWHLECLILFPGRLFVSAAEQGKLLDMWNTNSLAPHGITPSSESKMTFENGFTTIPLFTDDTGKLGEWKPLVEGLRTSAGRGWGLLGTEGAEGRTRGQEDRCAEKCLQCVWDSVVHSQSVSAGAQLRTARWQAVLLQRGFCHHIRIAELLRMKSSVTFKCHCNLNVHWQKNGQEDVAHVPNGILLSHEKEWNSAICYDVERPRDCPTEWSMKKTAYNITYVGNLEREYK